MTVAGLLFERHECAKALTLEVLFSDPDAMRPRLRQETACTAVVTRHRRTLPNLSRPLSGRFRAITTDVTPRLRAFLVTDSAEERVARANRREDPIKPGRAVRTRYANVTAVPLSAGPRGPSCRVPPGSFPASLTGACASVAGRMSLVENQGRKFPGSRRIRDIGRDDGQHGTDPRPTHPIAPKRSGGVQVTVPPVPSSISRGLRSCTAS